MYSNIAGGKQQAEDEASTWTLTYHHSIRIVIIRIICRFVVFLCNNISCDGTLCVLCVWVYGVVGILRFDFSHCVNRTHSNFVCAPHSHPPLHNPCVCLRLTAMQFVLISPQFVVPTKYSPSYTTTYAIASYMHTFTYICVLAFVSLALLRLIIHLCVYFPFFCALLV